MSIGVYMRKRTIILILLIVFMIVGSIRKLCFDRYINSIIPTDAPKIVKGRFKHYFLLEYFGLNAIQNFLCEKQELHRFSETMLSKIYTQEERTYFAVLMYLYKDLDYKKKEIVLKDIKSEAFTKVHKSISDTIDVDSDVYIKFKYLENKFLIR